PGSARASAASARACTPAIHAAKSVSVALASIREGSTRGRRERLEDFILEHAHLLLRALEPLAQSPGELQAPLVGLQRLLERQAAFLHLRDDFLELREGLFEGELGARL